MTKLLLMIESIHKKIRLFKCGKCNASLGTQLCLEKHVMAIHEGKKPFNGENIGEESEQHCSMKEHNTYDTHECIFKMDGDILCKFKFNRCGLHV